MLGKSRSEAWRDYYGNVSAHIFAKNAYCKRICYSDPVFLTFRGEPLTVDALSLLFRRLRKRSGIQGKRVSPHQCRRYMATAQLAAGRSPLDVQRQMGHTSLKMTNHYYSQTVEQLQRSQEAYSPFRIGKKNEGESSGSETGYWDE